MRAGNTSTSRLRIAALTLWLPIVALALLPALAVGAASSEEASWALVTAGGFLLGGGLVYLLVASSAHHREVFGVSVALLGTVILSLTANHNLLMIAPWGITFAVEAIVRLRRGREKDEKKSISEG